MKYKYIKSILLISIIASVAGFVVWHLMWMTDIEKKFRTEESSGVVTQAEVREIKSAGQKGKTEKNQSAEGAMSVKESGTQIGQTEAIQQETEKQGSRKAAGGTELPDKETKPESLKEDGKWFEKDISLGKKQQEVKPVPGKTTTEIPNDKTMPVTIGNKSDPIMQKNIPQPVQRPEVKVIPVTPHPTSTATK